MGWLKKKEVPDELPNLAVDEHSVRPTQEAVRSEARSAESYRASPVQKLSAFGSPQPTLKATVISQEDEQGYFKDLIKSVTEGTEDVDKIASWYEEKFLPADMVFHMREYWERQQPEILLKNVSGDLKNKLVEKTNKLHQLEKEWQEVYFALLGKEEVIRKEEKELKESLSEFIDVYKNSAKSKKLK